jgi:uncharacterized RDD family membrane protein YckC
MFAYSIDVVVVVLLSVFLLIVLFAALPIGAALEKWFGSMFREAAHAASSEHGRGIGHLDGVFIAAFLLARFVVESGYFIFWEMVTNGRSPGKAIVGLRTVCRDGMPLNLHSSVVRNTMRIVDMLPANYVVGFVSMLVSPSGQRLGDHVAGTIVVRLDRPEAAPDLQFDSDVTALQLTRHQLAQIGPRELQLVRGTLRRLTSLTDERGKQLAATVAETLRQRMGVDQQLPLDEVTFLRNLLVIAERHSRVGPP